MSISGDLRGYARQPSRVTFTDGLLKRYQNQAKGHGGLIFPGFIYVQRLGRGTMCLSESTRRTVSRPERAWSQAVLARASFVSCNWCLADVKSNMPLPSKSPSVRMSRERRRRVIFKTRLATLLRPPARGVGPGPSRPSSRASSRIRGYLPL